jgi:hypothetical protein
MKEIWSSSLRSGEVIENGFNVVVTDDGQYKFDSFTQEFPQVDGFYSYQYCNSDSCTNEYHFKNHFSILSRLSDYQYNKKLGRIYKIVNQVYNFYYYMIYSYDDNWSYLDSLKSDRDISPEIFSQHILVEVDKPINSLRVYYCFDNIYYYAKIWYYQGYDMNITALRDYSFSHSRASSFNYTAKIVLIDSRLRRQLDLFFTTILTTKTNLVTYKR